VELVLHAEERRTCFHFDESGHLPSKRGGTVPMCLAGSL
jgi:hypothetical protein